MRAALPRPASGRPRVEEAFDHFRRAGPARRTSPSPRSPPSTRAASSGRWRAARRTRPASRAPSTRRRRSCRWASDDRPPGRPWPWGLAPAPPLGTWSAPASADSRARSHTPSQLGPDAHMPPRHALTMPQASPPRPVCGPRAPRPWAVVGLVGQHGRRIGRSLFACCVLAALVNVGTSFLCEKSASEFFGAHAALTNVPTAL